MKYKTTFRNSNPGVKIEKIFRQLDLKVFSLPGFPKDQAFVAGGSIRDIFQGKRPRDFDVYFETRELAEDFISSLLSYKGLAEVTWESDNSTTVKITPNKAYKGDNCVPYKLDLIKISSGSPTQVLDRFDFTICCAAATKGCLFVHENFFQHLASKSLVFNKVQYNVVTMKRVIKYVSKGFYIDAANMLEAIEALRYAALDDAIKEKFLTTMRDYEGLELDESIIKADEDAPF